MSRYAKLIERARVGEIILIDGATGSECSHRGIPERNHGWSGGAALSHPDIVRQIHADYLEIGADLIISNTFATGLNILEDVGAPDEFEAVNRQAVELTVQARQAAGASADHVVIAAGISNWSFSENRPSLDQLRANTVRQANIMADAGAEMFILEMMVDVARMSASLDAVATIGLPVWVGFSIGPEEGHDANQLGDEVELREGGLLADAVAAAAQFDVVDAMCIMHTDVRLTVPSLKTLADSWQGPIGVYAHASKWVGDNVVHHGVVSPQDYAAHVPAWRQTGATMIGGCCGIGPEHLRAVKTQLGL